MKHLPAAAIAIMLALSATPRLHAAETDKATAMSAPDAWKPVQTVTLRVMNKLDSTVQTITLHVGETVTFQSLKISLLGCAIRPPDLPADAAAHLAIVDSRPGMEPYDNWILKNEPAINMLEHPVYDVQLASCV